MTKIEEVARAAIAGDALLTRSAAQDFLRENPHLVEVARPDTDDINILAMAAALLELFAGRYNQKAPTWTRKIGAVAEPIFLVQSGKSMKRMRALCEASSPTPLRKRKLYAPPNYLEFA